MDSGEMRTPRYDEDRSDPELGLSDPELDAVLAAADKRLLDVIYDSLDLVAGLAQIIGEPTVYETSPAASPATDHSSNSAEDESDLMTVSTAPQPVWRKRESNSDSRAHRLPYPAAGHISSRIFNDASLGEVAAANRLSVVPNIKALNRRPAMARNSSTAWDAKPHKPIRYGVAARLADYWAGRGDGRAGIPAIPAAPAIRAESAEILGMTPYLEIRSRHFLDSAERERRHMLTDLDPIYQQRAAVRQEIASGDEKVAEIRKRLDAIPETPRDVMLDARNAVEIHADEALVRARRLREHIVARTKVQAEERKAVEAVRALRVEEARLSEQIVARERILESRVRQLHQHTLRRCGTYLHHLVRRHRDGAALIPFLNLVLPALPEWLPYHDPGARQPMV